MFPGSENEKEIIQAAKTGDLVSFEKILFKYERRIWSYIYRLVGKRHDAEDLTQETFIKLYKNIGNVDMGKNFKSWLYRIATNTVYDWLRRKRSTPLFLDVEDPALQLETIESIDPYYYIDKTRDIETALMKVKPVYKTVLTLFYRENLTYEEIAEILNVPINTIKTYLRRAKQSLREFLEL